MPLDVGDYAQVQHEFQGESASDLYLEVGDVVKITESLDANWLKGEKVGIGDVPPSGSFPSSFVERLSLPSVRTGQKVFLVVQDFMAEENGDLELSKGEIIIGTDAVDESWWRGKNGPLKGIFPLSFVAELWHDDGLRSRSVSARSSSLKSRSGSFAGLRSGSIVGDERSGGEKNLEVGVTKVTEQTFAQALVDVNPQLDGELAFQLGDLIEITEIIDQDWFFGRCRNKEGLVSAVCVELLEGDTEEESTVESQMSSDTKAKDLQDIPVPFDSGDNLSQVDDNRLRNLSSASYTSENTRSHDAEIAPYARVLFPFQAEGQSELSLMEGQIVTLVRHLDSDWTEGEVDGHRGMFPKSFVEIVVDCPSLNSSCSARENSFSSRSSFNDTASPTAYTSSNNTEKAEIFDNEKKSVGITELCSNKSIDLQSSISESFTQSKPETITETSNERKAEKWGGLRDEVENHGTISAGITEVLEISAGSEIGLVLHTFEAQVAGDVTVQEGETVEVLRRVDNDWLEVKIDCDQGQRSGLVPFNHVEIIGHWGSSPSGDNSKVLQETLDAKSSESNNLSHKAESSATIGNQQSANSSKISPTPKPPRPPVPPSFKRKSSLQSTVLPNKPCLPPKPSVTPKPAVKPKPSLQPVSIPSKNSLIRAQSLDTPRSPQSDSLKPPLERSQTLNNSQQKFVTAKPFSSLPRAKPHHVVSPTERRLSLSSLDAIVEGEMEKAKSRTSSQASSSSDKSSLNDQNSDASLQNNGLSSSNGKMGASDTSTDIVKTNVSHQLLCNSESRAASEQMITEKVSQETLSQTSRDQLILKNAPEKSAHPGTVNKIQNTSKTLPSTYMAIKGINDSLESSLKKKSVSHIDEKQLSGSTAAKTDSEEGSKKSAFVNQAFEMDIDEGKLVDIPKDNHSTSQAPKIRPSTTPVVPLPGMTVSKTKNVAPPRPSGPRIAPAPSRVPLEPARVAPVPPKQETRLVPRRPAPKPPSVMAAGLNTGSANSDGKTSSGVEQTSLSSNAPTQSRQARPASQPLSVARPARQAPRPASLASPPPRAPPPRPADLMNFSPEDKSQGISEETTKQMVKDIKAKLIENNNDIKRVSA